MTGQELRERRARLGLSQARLGAVLGVPENTIYRWERGTLPIEKSAMLDLALTHLEDRAMTAPVAPAAPPREPKTIFFHVPYRGPHRWHGQEGGHTVDLAALSPNARLLAETISTTQDGFLWVRHARSYRERGFQPRPEAVERMYAGLLPTLDDHERRTWSFPGWCFAHYAPLITPEQYLEREAARMVAEGWQLIGESDSRMDALHAQPALPWPEPGADA